MFFEEFFRQFFSRLSRNYFHTWGKPMSPHSDHNVDNFELYLIPSSRDSKSSRIDTKSDGQDPPPTKDHYFADYWPRMFEPFHVHSVFLHSCQFWWFRSQKPFKFSGSSLSPERRLPRETLRLCQKYNIFWWDFIFGARSHSYFKLYSQVNVSADIQFTQLLNDFLTS